MMFKNRRHSTLKFINLQLLITGTQLKELYALHWATSLADDSLKKCKLNYCLSSWTLQSLLSSLASNIVCDVSGLFVM